MYEHWAHKSKKSMNNPTVRDKIIGSYVEIAVDVTIHDGPIGSETSLKL